MKFRMEVWSEDLTQEILCDLIRSVPAFDPTRLSSIFARLKPIIRNGCLDFVNRDLVWLKSESLPDNTEAKGDELQADPLDWMSREAWETDYPELPIPVPRDRRFTSPQMMVHARRRGEAFGEASQ